MGPERFVFIVRVWQEHDPQLAAPVLRGSVQPLGPAAPLYFDSLDKLLAVVQAALAAPTAGTASLPHPPQGS